MRSDLHNSRNENMTPKPMTQNSKTFAVKSGWSKVGTFSWKTNFRDDRRPQPNWAGFMQEVSSGVHPSVAEFRMLLIIDMTSSDKSCVFFNFDICD